MLIVLKPGCLRLRARQRSRCAGFTHRLARGWQEECRNSAAAQGRIDFGQVL